MELNQYIDHTNVCADATKEQIRILCEEAIEHHFATVCINPCYVELAASLLERTNVEIAAVVGFPLGANTLAVKEYEAICAVEAGATEIDMVINIGALKDKDYEYVQTEIETIRDAIGGRPLKVIIETGYLTSAEIKKITTICNDTYVHFIKTSTGFGSRGVSIKDIETILEVKNEVLEIKVSGGIKTFAQAEHYITLGATRIGTSSGVEIVKGDHHEDI